MANIYGTEEGAAKAGRSSGRPNFAGWGEGVSLRDFGALNRVTRRFLDFILFDRLGFSFPTCPNGVSRSNAKLLSGLLQHGESEKGAVCRAYEPL